jgi:hypothetical protein
LCRYGEDVKDATKEQLPRAKNPKMRQKEDRQEPNVQRCDGEMVGKSQKIQRCDGIFQGKNSRVEDATKIFEADAMKSLRMR